MFLRRTFGQGLEPVRDMRHVMFQGPFLHALRDTVGRLPVQRLASFDAFKQGIESLGVQILLHLVPVEGQFAEILGRPLRGGVHGPRLLHEGFPHQIESVHICRSFYD